MYFTFRCSVLLRVINYGLLDVFFFLQKLLVMLTLHTLTRLLFFHIISIAQWSCRRINLIIFFRFLFLIARFSWFQCTFFSPLSLELCIKCYTSMIHHLIIINCTKHIMKNKWSDQISTYTIVTNLNFHHR